ncbi:DUF6185 family protein [Streptomyces sp. NPDC127190]|uniref:DUF6185 family protein n=1 Tax=unclassified Streptomyces TaxID=2593676 RepID=UPI00363E77FB
MQGIRWRRFLLLMVLAAMWWVTPSAEARQNNSDACWAHRLDASTVDARIQFDQHSKNYLKIYSYMMVRVPLNQWPAARQLTFSEDSADYHKAMHCLLRGTDNGPRQEWRPHDPVVTADTRNVTVQYDSFTWIKNYRPIRLGPWQIARDSHRMWQIRLLPPTLQNAHWQTIKAEMGGMRFNDSSKLASSSNEKTLLWENQKPTRITFKIDLPWQRYWRLSYDQSIWNKVGVAAWWVSASLVIALAARRTRRTHSAAAAGASAPTAQAVVADTGRDDDSAAGAVLQWALLSGAFALMLLLLISQPPISPRWRALVCVAAGLALVLVARPWYSGTPVPAPDGATGDTGTADSHRPRQRYAVLGVASAVAAIALLVILAPAMFGLPDALVSKAEPSVSGDIGYVLMGLAIVWLWLAAMAAWAWRFAREGALLPGSWYRTWNNAPVRCVLVVSTLLAAVAGSLLGCFWWVAENQWKRLYWLTDQNAVHGYGEYASKSRANFSFTGLIWIFAYSWILTGVALFALLHFHFGAQRTSADHKHEKPILGPAAPDLLLVAAVFVFTVGLRGAAFAGINYQYGVWIILNMGSLFVVLAVGRKWAVLNQLGNTFCVKRLRSMKRRGDLMAKAHEYRNINHQLQLLDQGRAGNVTREELEGRLRALRRWLVDGCGEKKPPAYLSVLDAALAWGPRDHWWNNGVHAGCVAFCFGIPASGALLYLDTKDPWSWIQLTSEPTAIPGVVANFLAYQVAWAGAGFVLGALWRVLPGRHSPARAWSLTFAYAVPACLFLLLNEFTGVDFRDLLFYSVLMLLILTLTSIWMDTSTFGEERQYWPRRLALLLSLYQLRGLSTQGASILAQIGVAVAIWHQLTSH